MASRRIPGPRHHELVVVADPASSNAGDWVTQMLEKANARITRFEDWGRRPLAYRIDNHTTGQYLLVNFSIDSGDPLDSLQRDLDASPQVLRSLLTRTSKEVSVKSPMMEKPVEEPVAA